MPESSQSQPDLPTMRAYRLDRVRRQLERLNYVAAVLFDPINIRYATGASNMQIWTQHSPDRYAFVPAEGPVIVFDNTFVSRPSPDIEIVDEWRPAMTWYFEAKAQRSVECARRWADEIAELVRVHGGGDRRLAIDRLGIAGFAPLLDLGIELFDAQEPLELARCIKSPDEILCMKEAVAACEAGVAQMRNNLRPGMSENELWALLVQTSYELGGESMETRLLSSGPRTNPWYQECGDRKIRAGELVAFDTDMIGPHGMCVDMSRTFHSGPQPPTPTQKELYRTAHKQVAYNIELLKPGMSFRDYAEQAWPIPDRYAANRYGLVAHGVGMADEYPDLADLRDWEENGYDGTIKPHMVLSVESYVGEVGGAEGVKLEDQVLVTTEGVEVLTRFPYEEALLE